MNELGIEHYRVYMKFIYVLTKNRKGSALFTQDI